MKKVVLFVFVFVFGMKIDANRPVRCFIATGSTVQTKQTDQKIVLFLEY